MKRIMVTEERIIKQQVEVEKWKTSDCQIFECKSFAEEHERQLAEIKHFESIIRMDSNCANLYGGTKGFWFYAENSKEMKIIKNNLTNCEHLNGFYRRKPVFKLKTWYFVVFFNLANWAYSLSHIEKKIAVIKENILNIEKKIKDFN